MPDVSLRPAHPGDLNLLRSWDERPHVLASDPNDDWAWETELARNPPWREQLIGEVGGRQPHALPAGAVEVRAAQHGQRPGRRHPSARPRVQQAGRHRLRPQRPVQQASMQARMMADASPEWRRCPNSWRRTRSRRPWA